MTWVRPSGSVCRRSRYAGGPGLIRLPGGGIPRPHGPHMFEDYCENVLVSGFFKSKPDCWCGCASAPSCVIKRLIKSAGVCVCVQVIEHFRVLLSQNGSV